MLLSFNWEIFWNAFSAIATTITAIVAIIISLLSNKKAYSKKIKIEYDFRPYMYDGLPDVPVSKVGDRYLEKFKMDVNIFVNILNTGASTLMIYDFGLYVKNDNVDEIDYFYSQLSKRAKAIELKPSLSISFEMQYSEFNKRSNENKGNKCYFYCKTSNGVYYSKRIKHFDMDTKKIVLNVTKD